MEYYYQLCNKEISFADIKQQFPEATYHNNKKLKLLSDNLRSLALRSSVYIPAKPISNGKNKFLVFMLTNRQPAQLDDALRNKLLVDLEKQWCEREIKRLLDDSSDMQMQMNKIPHQQSSWWINQWLQLLCRRYSLYSKSRPPPRSSWGTVSHGLTSSPHWFTTCSREVCGCSLVLKPIKVFWKKRTC